MSIVAQVMQSLGMYEQRSIHEGIDSLTARLADLTVEAHQFSESKYRDFAFSLDTAEDLEKRVDTLCDEMAAMKEKMEDKVNNQMTFSTGEFQDLSSRLAESRARLEGLQALTKFLTLLEDSKTALENQQYSNAAKYLSEADSKINTPLTDRDNEILILQALKEEIFSQKAQLDCTLSDLWKECVQWDIKTEKGPSSVSPQSVHQEVPLDCIREVTLTVASVGHAMEHIKELVRGLHCQNLLKSRLKIFTERFSRYLVPLIVEYPDLSVQVSALGTKNVLTLSVPQQGGDKKNLEKKRVKAESSDRSQAYERVFGHMTQMMEALSNMLLSVCPEGGTGASLMSWLGTQTADATLEQLQKLVIAPAVPTNFRDLEGFTKVADLVRELHATFLRLDYLPAENQTLLHCVENVHMLFSNKKSQAILVRARELMTSDLHDSIPVSDDRPQGEWLPLAPGGVKKGQRLEVASETQLSDNTFRMPRCRISSSTETLVQLAYETLSEASESSEKCALQMCLAVRSMFEMFCEVVPTHHGQSLETFPNIAALHHNNCMYLAHHLMTLGHQFALRLPHLTCPTFVDLIQTVRCNGVDVLLNQISRQAEILLEYLQAAQEFGQLEDATRSATAKKSISQVLLQLEHLHKVWKPVLPVHNYKKAMGRLINCVVSHITDCVVRLEDIATSATTSLLSLLSPLEPQCGAMLVSLPGEDLSVELSRHVTAWPRLSELMGVLSASLAEVRDRWAGGQGPLANAFSASEVRQLVRALFQNTDRRAAALAEIK